MHTTDLPGCTPTSLAAYLKAPGVLLCTDNDQTKVEYAAGGLDHQLFVSRYLVVLPGAAELERLIETDRAVWEQNQPKPSS